METTDRPPAHPILSAPFRVGDWVAEPMANQLTRGETVRRVEPKVMEVLACMAAVPGETVTKDEFMAEVWTGTIVTDDVLARCISELRKALGDKARSPSYVETIRKRGYRLIAQVETDVEATAVDGVAVEAAPGAVSLAAPPGLDLRRPELPTRTRPTVVLWALAAVAVVALGAVLAYQAGVAGVRPLATTPLTSYPGDERDPALSPDGSRVAFAWNGEAADGEPGAFDVYVQDARGGAAPTRLTNHPADERSPAWSPDGQRVAFVRCGVGGECGVYVVGAGGGAARTLAEPEGLAVEDLVWSPDGQTLAFSARRGRQGAFSLHLLPLDGSRPQRLTSPASTYPGDLAPAFSPDGQRLAFVRTALDGRQDVAVVSVQGGPVRRLAREQKGVTGLDWTADGEVVYAANRDGAAGLWRVPREGGAPRWIALGSDGGEIAGPSVARRGRGIAFAQQRVQSQIIQLAPGDDRGRLLLRSTRDDFQPAVAPDGSRTAFVSTRSGSHEVWSAAPDGSGARQLTDFGGARVSSPRWSPDGRRLAVSARAQGNADVFVVLPDGEARQITTDSADDVAPSWSRDGMWVYFASDRGDTWQIYRVPAAGGDPEPVTVGGGVAAAEAPGGGLLVIRPDKRGLWLLPPGTDGLPQDAAARRLPANLSPADWANWTVSGPYVYVLERRYDRAATVVRLDPATGRRVTVATAQDVPEDSGLAVFPGGQRFLLARQERADSDIGFVADFD
ncbi:winged helix-turn-helix domain-containing protein [Rubrivirga litoralis]|uniref:Winged helix-turn-helix domain-containing protein n=1 Tax=Rubrivirga litoralis TaxID=3075598 RepID=A0ABU3BSL9_9BACT|nr:winged helix-turn-helix domain-containing protein [Rubrivirga sp. F394]MDT0632295.1 winged helix-turn-helix domain-containing protein [Rubrivirga sp. F394]